MKVFERTAQSLRLPSVNPQGLKTFTLSFTVSVYPAGSPWGGRVALTIKALRNRAERSKCS